MRNAIVLVTLAGALAFGGCADFPKDAADTLEQVRAGRPLRVGWSAAEPWVKRGAGGEPRGLEPDLIRAWAAASGARVVWVEAGEAQLVEGLNRNALDIAVAGFTASAPYGGAIGQTQPYLKARMVIGARGDAGVPDSWRGVVVAHAAARADAAAALLGKKAVPVTHYAPFRAVWEPELAAAGLAATGTTLTSAQRVIAIAPSENALTLSLDRFLHSRKAAIEARLAREAGR